MIDINKKVEFYIDGATIDDVACWLEGETWDVLQHNRKRHFKVDLGHLTLSRAERIPPEADPFRPRRTEIAMNVVLGLDDHVAAGVASEYSNCGPYIRFLVDNVRSEPPNRRLKVIALLANWRAQPPTLHAYFDALVVAMKQAFKVDPESASGGASPEQLAALPMRPAVQYVRRTSEDQLTRQAAGRRTIKGLDEAYSYLTSPEETYDEGVICNWYLEKYVKPNKSEAYMRDSKNRATQRALFWKNMKHRSYERKDT